MLILSRPEELGPCFFAKIYRLWLDKEVQKNFKIQKSQEIF